MSEISDTTLSDPSFDQPQTQSERGLRSAPGIRWLLLAGALVTGVSIYRLVQSQWAAIPQPLQFLILVAGALAIFALGSVTRRRLHLPYAGSALLFLFAGLVPVLAWGAAYLKLLETPSGWIAFGAGAAALLGAAVSLMRSVLRYRGWIYPAALGGLLAAQPVLPWLGARWPAHPNAVYTAAALLLGALLHLGSREANRSLFHRDRLDGRDRPVHLVPFLMLGLLYLGGLILLDLHSDFLALPMAVMGIVLAGTGEEYYQALSRSLGRTLERWPRRSLALLALGFSLTVAAVPLSTFDASGRCLPAVALLGAALCLRWSVRYGLASIHALGILLAAVAWETGLDWFGVSTSSDVITGWKYLGFGTLLILLAALLDRLKAPERLRRTHGVLTALVLLVVIVPAMACGSALLLAAVLAVVVAGLPFFRRIEVVAVAPFALAALAATPFDRNLPAACAAGLATLVLALASRFLEPGLAKITGSSVTSARRVLLAPAAAIGAGLALLTVIEMVFVHPSPLGGIDLLLAGAIWMTAGYRVRSPFAFTLGGVVLSFGSHYALAQWQGGHVTGWTALLTQGLFVLAWLLARETSGSGRLDPELHGSVRVLALLHGVLGLVWLGHAAFEGRLTIEPLILLLLGLALVRDGVASEQHEAIDFGLAALVAWAPFQILGWIPSLPWTTALLSGLAIAGVVLGLLIVASRRAPGRRMALHYEMETDEFTALLAVSLSGLQRFWRLAAVAACLLFAGPPALALSLVLVGVELVARREIYGLVDFDVRAAMPARLALLPLLQLAVLIQDGGTERWLPAALLFHRFALLPWLALFAFAWSTLTRTLLAKDLPLRGWALALEAGTALGFGAAFLFQAHYLLWANAALIAVAAGWITLAVLDARRERDTFDGWRAHAWAGLAVLHGFTAGWLHLGSPYAPYLLLGLGAAEYALGAWLARTDLGPAFADPSRRIGLALPVLAGAVALYRLAGASSGRAWLWALPAFLVSLFYKVAASREPKRIFPSLAAAGFLGTTLLMVTAIAGLGSELYPLGPGFALLGLAWLLRAELGPQWSRHLTAAGAACVYATPIVALSNQISWAWLAALLVMTVAFGAASFSLRSRSLLTVSTAALLTDLGFMVFRIGTTAPMLLWVLGLAFGLTLMAVAAWLEYQHEGVLQQIRVFGRELEGWS
ncbi:MAG: hypothetical protein QOF89_1576 [Acidobacteriota bacterium]|nr:hypothetical protein [Acidobacteriota bacterium]